MHNTFFGLIWLFQLFQFIMQMTINSSTDYLTWTDSKKIVYFIKYYLNTLMIKKNYVQVVPKNNYITF